jgi:hypothetical protein
MFDCVVDTVTDWHSKTLYKYFPLKSSSTAHVEKTCFSNDELTDNIRLTLSRWRREMKSYDELKAEMEAIQQQMLEAKRNERTQ